MIKRLVETIMLVFNQQIHSDENELIQEKKKIVNNEPLSPVPPPPLPPPLPSLPPIEPPKQPTTNANNGEQGWASWAWSYVPSVTTLFVEDDPPNEANGTTDETQLKTGEIPLVEPNLLISNNDTSINHTPTPILFAGIDLDRISLQYKVISSIESHENNIYVF
jgi:hypothetical protein